MKSRREMTGRLTVFLETLGHGFPMVECAGGINITAGFYPGEPETQCKEMEKEDNSIDNQSQRKIIQRGAQTVMPSCIAEQVVPHISQHPISSAAIATIGSVYNPFSTQYHIQNEAAVDGKSRCDASADGINFVSHSGYFKEQLESFYRVSYEINSEDCIKVYKRIKELAENTIIGKKYSYLGGNCLDFTKEIYDLTSLEKKSLIGIYNLNPVLSIAGLNGPAPAYMAVRSAYDTAYSNPAVAVGTGLALYGIFKWGGGVLKWGASKLFQSKSPKPDVKFDPSSLIQNKKADLSRISKNKQKIMEINQELETRLKKTRIAHNRLSGKCVTVSEKEEFEEIDNYYKLLKELKGICEVTLGRADQLRKDYLSLFTTTHTALKAQEIVKGIQDLKTFTGELVQIMNSQPSNDKSQRNLRSTKAK